MLETTRTYWHDPSPATGVDAPTPAGLNATVRSLFARLSLAAPAAPARPAQSERPLAPEPVSGEADRRARAHAAFRIVRGTDPAALDAALGVVEAEVSRLRRTVLTYGEALKAIQIYGTDDEARRTAAAALRRAPERLRAAPPVPQRDRIETGAARG